MKVTVELSVYPLMNEYEATILDFIKRLKSHDGIEVFTNAMSTQLTGDWNEVMNVLNNDLKEVFQHVETCSVVMKIINRKLPIEAGHLSF